MIQTPKKFPHPLHNFNQCTKSNKRFVSGVIAFTAIDKSSKYPRSSNMVHKLGKLRVPLLKSPSYFGHFTSRVNRLYNEDKYSANVLTLPEDRTVFNFNIFDGHGGEQCSTFLKDNLSQEIENANELSQKDNSSVRNELVKSYWKNIGGYWKRWYKHKDANFETMLPENNSMKLTNIKDTQDDLSLRLPLSFLETDYKFFKDEDKSGSTCTSAFLETIYSESTEADSSFEKYYFNRNTISKLTIAQVGDTRAILVDKNGQAHALTQSHHPSNPTESKRLRKYAANFFMTDSFGEERFIALANTRAFGDVSYKEMGVTAEPDVVQLIVGDNTAVKKQLTAEEIKNYTVGALGGDESFLVLCTDGVTDVLTDQEIGDIVMVHYNMKGHPKASPQLCAEEVVKFVEYVGGDDNATCLVIRLNGWGSWPILDRTGQLRQERMKDYSPRGERV